MNYFCIVPNLLGLQTDAVDHFCLCDERECVSDISADNAAMVTPDDWADHCKNCGAVITQTPHSKEKYFCSPACRQSWWNAHLDLVKRKAFYSFTCITCGKKLKRMEISIENIAAMNATL